MIILLHLLMTMRVGNRDGNQNDTHTCIVAFSFCGHIQSSIFLAARHHEVLKSAYPQVFQLANLFWELLQAILVKVQHLQQNVKP